MIGWMNDWMDWMDESMDGLGGWMDECVGWLNGWMEEWMYEIT